VVESGGQHHLINPDAAEQAQMTLEQRHAAEGQQALGGVLIFVLLESQPTSGRQNNRSHQKYEVDN
jgi:hypothetical protein